MIHPCDGQTDRRTGDSIYALLHAVARKKRKDSNSGSEHKWDLSLCEIQRNCNLVATKPRQVVVSDEVFFQLANLLFRERCSFFAQFHAVDVVFSERRRVVARQRVAVGTPSPVASF